ncbi:hypothetical protein Pfo_031147 [Paulownia fortunei]|nr:hypothetical protein Pfo_031147 [Paulownia fortunei]
MKQSIAYPGLSELAGIQVSPLYQVHDTESNTNQKDSLCNTQHTPFVIVKQSEDISKCCRMHTRLPSCLKISCGPYSVYLFPNKHPHICTYVSTLMPMEFSNYISFSNPKAPLYPRLAQGNGYNIDEAVPFVEWGWKGHPQVRSPAGTLTFSRGGMCGAPARTVGWRDPGFIHTSFLMDLWPNTVYTYKMGHLLSNGSYIWSKTYSFRSSPYPGQDSLQRVIVFGDMGKAERDGSNEYADYQPGSLNTTDRLIEDLQNYDIVFHIGDLPYANGYISQWDQFTAQVETIASAVPYMIARLD